MLGVGLILFYFALAALAAAVILQPDRYVVRRVREIDAGAGRIFARATDPARWSALGRATLVESEPNRRIAFRLGAGASVATIALSQEGRETRVEVAVSGRNTLVDKATHLLGRREKILGPKIDKALADLSASV